MDSASTHNPSNGSFPIKRKPEEEVQFVSSKPVKKGRGSKDSPAEAHPAVDQVNTSRVCPPHGDAHPVNTPTHVGPSLPASQPLHELSNFNRGASLPSMENYVFPPPLDGIPSQTSRSSPMLSPKQLPQAVPSSQADNQLNPSVHLNANDAKLPAWCNVSWAPSCMPPQSMSMNAPMTPNQSVMTPYTQPPVPEPSPPVHGEKQKSRTSDKLATLPPQCSESVIQPRKDLGTENTHSSQEYPLEAISGPIQTTQPSGPQIPWQPAQSTSQIPPGPAPHIQSPAQQHVGNSHGYVVANAHALPPKPPCLACEQMRQQALHNKAAIYPVVGNSPHDGWHGPEVAHGNHPAHMQPMPFPAGGFGVRPNMVQSHLHRPQHLYHGQVPMGYGMTPVSTQVPYPAPVQRALPVPQLGTSDSPSGVSSQKFTNPQLNASPVPATMSRTERNQPGASSQALSTQPSSATASSPNPAAAATPRPPTPPPSESHSPNLIVDIAETCEALFPWDEVAERHNVQRQKVLDTFAAIIQLPLIRCTTDKKRHGRLATNRLKDYTRGKNIMNMASSGSPATTATAPSKSNSKENHGDRAVLPGVVELANSMAPVTFPSALAQKYPGTW
ncbi:hypothetical protein KVR01_002338 [Diaporthe batatas]|uniref:uncharacterized protein n=1 Tax=Diaporthe batatas TaxID=748121 RepID=UPI001D05774E|nr:uncharacterized protein KVR01_002338 [Diaporthe batatas]KAG8166649.1 hypothetical protein KVR01_002338 [Diaporthe batatas]